MARLVDREKKRKWKLVNAYSNGVASIVIISSVIIDLVSIFAGDTVKK